MSFSVCTNIASLKTYNALSKIAAQTQKAQLCLSTTKKINSVGDDTSGFNVVKKLEAQTLSQKAQLNNVSSAKNYLSTAEKALQQMNDKMNAISAKYIDSKDALKDQTSIVRDIRTLAGEVDSILKNTNINARNLLAQSNGSALTSSDSFNIGGTEFTVDFASDTYLKANELKAALNGSSTDPGVTHYTGSNFNAYDSVTVPDGTSALKMTFADGSTSTLNVNLSGCTQIKDVYNAFFTAVSGQSDFIAGGGYLLAPPGVGSIDMWYYYNFGDPDDHGPNIVSFETTSGFDVAGTLGITRHSSGTFTGGLMSSEDSSVLSSASNISAISDNIKSALGRIGNLYQTLESRGESLSTAIANNTNTISKLLDADMAEEQLNATKGNIAQQIAITMLAQVNTAPQQLLTLFS